MIIFGYLLSRDRKHLTLTQSGIRTGRKFLLSMLCTTFAYSSGVFVLLAGDEIKVMPDTEIMAHKAKFNFHGFQEQIEIEDTMVRCKKLHDGFFSKLDLKFNVPVGTTQKILSPEKETFFQIFENPQFTKLFKLKTMKTKY
jgi:hypothetical protein